MNLETQIAHIPLHAIAPDPAQPRRTFAEDALQELAASLRDLGVIQPIVVRPFLLVPGEQVDIAAPTYRIIAGERRWRAAHLAGLSEIPAVVRTDLSDADIAVLQIVENLQRAELTLPELAAGCSTLISHFQQQINAGALPAGTSALALAAERLGKSKSWVSKRAGITRLRPEVRALVDDGVIVDVELAHGIDQVFEYNVEQGDDLLDWAAHPESFGGALTRGVVAEQLSEVKKRSEFAQQRRAQTALATAEAQRAQRAATPLAGGDLFTPEETPNPPAAKAAPVKTESSIEREIRLRAEAWAEIAPECRKHAREQRSAILAALTEQLGEAGEGFAFSIGLPEHYSAYDAPATAGANDYTVDVKGDTQHAGALLEALNPAHGILVNIRVPVAQVRAIEQIIGTPLRISECLRIKGRALIAAARQIRAANTELANRAEAEDAQAGIAKFLAEKTRHEPGSRVKSADLYAAYAVWCEAQQRPPVPATSNAWGAAIAAAGIQKIRSNGWRYLDLAIES